MSAFFRQSQGGICTAVIGLVDFRRLVWSSLQIWWVLLLFATICCMCNSNNVQDGTTIESIVTMDDTTKHNSRFHCSGYEIVKNSNWDSRSPFRTNCWKKSLGKTHNASASHKVAMVANPKRKFEKAGPGLHATSWSLYLMEACLVRDSSAPVMPQREEIYRTASVFMSENQRSQVEPGTGGDGQSALTVSDGLLW